MSYPQWFTARLSGDVTDEYAPFEIIDAVSGEVFLENQRLFTVGDTPHGRRRISQYMRRLDVDEIHPDLAKAVGCPDDWEYVPGLTLSEQAYVMAYQSRSMVEKTREIERRHGVLRYKNQVDGNGDRKRLRRVLDPFSATWEKIDPSKVTLIPKKDGTS